MVNQVFEYNQHVTVAFSLHSLKSEGRSGTFLVGNIERDQQISPTITCIDLYNTAIRIIEPMWNNWAPGYPLPVGELEMYKIPRLLLYSPASPGAGQVALDEPAIYQFFLTVKAGRSSSTPTFSASKRIGIMLLMQNELYGEVFDWKEAREARVPAVAQAEQNRTEEDSEVAEIPGLSDVACDRILGISGQSKQGSKSTGKRSRKASNSQPTDVKSKRSTQHGQGLSARSALSSDRPESSKVQEKNANDEDENDFIIIANNDRSKPDSQVPTASCSNAIPQPIRQHIPTEGAASGGPSIVLPDIAKLRDALSKQDGARSQAKSLRKQIAINVQLFLIPALDFHTLLNKKTFVVDVNNIGDSDRHLVELFVDASNHIGLAGSFKTAHSASIKPFLPQSASVLGTPSIVAKRLFLLQRTDHDLTQQSRPKRIRMKSVDELPRMIDEANCLYWGTALMDLVYKFVDRKMEKMPVNTAPVVPRLRFVHSALAVPVENTDPVYLIEERIPDHFTKYIVNSSLQPMPNLEGAAKDIAEFLCFAQHVQYQLSEQRVFLSDFQGGSTLLTDCQIITIEEYSANFGAGNLSDVLKKFEREHCCNSYCRIFNLVPSASAEGRHCTPGPQVVQPEAAVSEGSKAPEAAPARIPWRPWH
ncbi:hypothetical protein EW026_g7790 [Hermanssonia centrifuga]|uniref:Alpha-type protein kinase domain-containing protein n=1 Tax=Hermanssonia centrifuga TaxID=98765 RepID=A0A4S4KAZ5_9APHY|nr:hypothetical protein EW026_g7790 [Hermanssonia centrifuga]